MEFNHTYRLNILHSNFPNNEAPKGTESGVGFSEWMKFGKSETKKCPYYRVVFVLIRFHSGINVCNLHWGHFQLLNFLIDCWIFSYLYSIVSSLWLCDFLIRGKGFAIMVSVLKRSRRNWVVWHAPCQAGSILRYKYTHYQRNISAQLLTADKCILNIYLAQVPRN